MIITIKRSILRNISKLWECKRRYLWKKKSKDKREKNKYGRPENEEAQATIRRMQKSYLTRLHQDKSWRVSGLRGSGPEG